MTRFKILLRFIVCLQIFCLGSAGQVAQPTPPGQAQDDVVRVYTDLVQTDFMVFDKSGRFVDGIKQDQLQLIVDGKPVPIRFFEQIKAGTANEEAQLAAARGARAPAEANVPKPLDRGRPIFFFVDDLHITATTLDQAAKVLLRFIDHDMKQNDQAEIASTSGRLGILQQLTDNKAVLRRAVERLTPHGRSTKDLDRPPMSEFEALQVDRGDLDALNYFVAALLAQNRIMSRSSAEDEVRRRASTILEQVSNSTALTLSSFEAFVRNCGKISGRKLVFLVSDGFFIDYRHSNTSERMREIISAAAHAGVVIYSIDARGLIASLTDASSDVASDHGGRMQRVRAGEIGESQNVLNSLARDTGGRALFDTNNLHLAVENGLRETSSYYLAVWSPLREGNASNKFRHLAITIAGRPDLSVRLRRGFFDTDAPAKETAEKGPVKSPEQIADAKLKEGIVSQYPSREIPLSLSLNYVDAPKEGTTLSVSVQIPREVLSNKPEGEKPQQIDVAGVVFDEQGQSSASFREQLTIRPSADNSKREPRDVSYTYKTPLRPGLYQVRVAAHDFDSGHTGSSNSWIEIPDLTKKNLVMSSLLVGERSKTSREMVQTSSTPTDPVLLKIDRRFKRDSFLRYLVFIYNATPSMANAKPDVVAQVQILRDDQPVATTTLKQIEMDSIDDPLRIPYAAELPLNGFLPGQYVLQVTAIDRISKRSTSQQVRFEID